MDDNIKDNVKKIIEGGKLNVDSIYKVSSAAYNLADWARNII